MRWQPKLLVLLAAIAAHGSISVARGADPLPFSTKIELYHDDEQDVSVFALRLEQPFLAEEFEASNYLRLQPLDEQAWLIYPRETRFAQKHAEFFGRLRGEGKARLRLAYETVHENLDGSRQVDTSHGELEIEIPSEDTGSATIYKQWAEAQNAHFAELLTYYPEESFFQFCLLQSRNRYGVTPPIIALKAPDPAELETRLFHSFTGSLALQESLQRQSLAGGRSQEDLNVPVSQLSPPAVLSPDYEQLLEDRIEADEVEPKPHEIARLVPSDMYFMHFRTFHSARDLLDFVIDWGDSVQRLLTLRARDNRVRDKFDDQLCLRRDSLDQLFADGAVTELALAGSDPFVVEGTDVTFIFHVAQPDVFAESSAKWLEEVREKYPEMVTREFNYQGHRVAVRYTDDRAVSSFVVEHGEYMVFSNSHRAVRAVIDAAQGKTPRLYDAPDYRYITTLLPPSDDPAAGYLYASDTFLRRMVGPEVKIAEKRRMQCFNNLVMLNNASLFYRLEHGTSPDSLSDLVEGHFIDQEKVICPHGGAYAFDAAHDAATCSLHNRLRLLTPNSELSVLQVSTTEQQQYDRYKERYGSFWKGLFNPLAARITVAPRLKLEWCVIPFQNSSLYGDLRATLDEQPQAIDTGGIAPSAIFSTIAVPGRQRIRQVLETIPGVAEAAASDPTLADLSWIGDRVSIHVCDEDMVFEIDPAHFDPLTVPFLGQAEWTQQALAAAALWGVQMPVYVTIDVEDRDKAARLLDQVVDRLFLAGGGDSLGVSTRLDAYRLPAYKDHEQYVLSFQLHAIKVRLHVALVGNQIIAATKPETIRQAIDASLAPRPSEPVRAHLLTRFNRKAIAELADDLDLYWEEKARLACHRNTISIYNLVKLYSVPVEAVNQIADAKYGVHYFCPDGGHFVYDDGRDQVTCSTHGNRQQSRQELRPDQQGSFAEFFESLDEIVTSLRFDEQAAFFTVEIARNTAE